MARFIKLNGTYYNVDQIWYLRFSGDDERYHITLVYGDIPEPQALTFTGESIFEADRQTDLIMPQFVVFENTYYNTKRVASIEITQYGDNVCLVELTCDNNSLSVSTYVRGDKQDLEYRVEQFRQN